MANEISVVFPFEKLKALVDSGTNIQYLKVTVGYDEKGLPSIWASLVPYGTGNESMSGDDDDGQSIGGCPDPPGCDGKP